jgi:nicotinate-nucleotide--dimethylbenzimidazole phosphoribosyltransferase
MSTAVKSTEWSAQARERFHHPTQPLGSLGYLEDLAVRLVGIQATLTPNLSKKRLCLFAASHGIAGVSGVSTFPPQAAGQRLDQLLNGRAPANVLARQFGVEVNLIDIGVDADLPALPRSDFFHRRIRRGTHNFLEAPAMTPEEARLALDAGREQAQLAQKEGVQLLGVGEVSVGQAVAASVLFSALMGLPPKISVEQGMGTSDAEVKPRTEIIAQTLKKYITCHQPLEWLAAVGGFEIAAVAGLILESARLRLPVLLDSFTTAAAALVARRLEPSSLDTCFFAQESAAQVHATILPLLDARPLLELRLQLGEGTGALLAMPLLESAAMLVGNSQKQD